LAGADKTELALRTGLLRAHYLHNWSDPIALVWG